MSRLEHLLAVHQSLAQARRALLMLALASSCSAAAQAPPPRIGFLGFDSNFQASRVAALVEGLREHGYVEGRSITIERRWADGRFDRLPALAAELVALRVDLIVTAAPPAVRAAQQATSTIPIVAAAMHEPVRMGFVASLARPGGNITGLAFQDIELTTKRLQLLSELVPRLTRVAVLWERSGGGEPALRAAEQAGRQLGIEIRGFEVREAADIAAAYTAARDWGAQARLVLALPFFATHHALMVEQLERHPLPTACNTRDEVRDGCLLAYSASQHAMFRRAANYVDRILKGARPGELPIEQPREFEFLLNRTALQALGLKPGRELLLQVTEWLPR